MLQHMLMTASNHFQDSMKALELKIINYVTVRLQHHINLTPAGTAPLDLRFHDTEYYNVEEFASTLLQYLLQNIDTYFLMYVTVRRMATDVDWQPDDIAPRLPTPRGAS